MMQYLCGLFALNSFLLCRFMCSRLLCLCQHFRIIQNDLNPRKERIFAQLYFRYKFISKVILKVIQGFLVNRFDLERAVSKSATNGMEEFCHFLVFTTNNYILCYIIFSVRMLCYIVLCTKEPFAERSRRRPN